MSQSPGKPLQNASTSGEEWLDFYTIYEHGNSRTLTVPMAAGFEPGTPLCLWLGRCNGRIVYLKAVAQETQAMPVTPSPSTDTVRMKGSADVVRETDPEFRAVREGSSEELMTVPADYDADVFGVESSVAMLVGTTTDGGRYLRIIPQNVWTETLSGL